MLVEGVIFVLAVAVGYLARELRQARKYRQRWLKAVKVIGELEAENRDLAIDAGVFNSFDRMELRERVKATQEEASASRARSRLDRDNVNYRKVLDSAYRSAPRGRHHWRDYR